MSEQNLQNGIENMNNNHKLPSTKHTSSGKKFCGENIYPLWFTLWFHSEYSLVTTREGTCIIAISFQFFNLFSYEGIITFNVAIFTGFWRYNWEERLMHHYKIPFRAYPLQSVNLNYCWCLYEWNCIFGFINTGGQTIASHHSTCETIISLKGWVYKKSYLGRRNHL